MPPALLLSAESRAFLERLKTFAPEYIGKLGSLSLWALNELKRRTPRSSLSRAHLQDHYVREVSSVRKNMVEIILRNVAPHAYVLNFLEDGTVPHRIPKTGYKTLCFRVGNETVFASVVNHPGTRPYRIMAGTKEAVDAELLRLNENFINAYVQKVVR